MYMWHRKIHNPRQKLKEQPKAAAAAKGKRQTTKARAQIATVSVNRLTHMFSTHILPIYIYTYISLSIYIFAKPKTCSKQWNFSACAASVQLLVFVLVLFLALVQYLPSSRSNFKSVGINFKQIYTQIHLTHPHVLVCLCVCARVWCGKSFGRMIYCHFSCGRPTTLRMSDGWCPPSQGGLLSMLTKDLSGIWYSRRIQQQGRSTESRNEAFH